MAGQAGRRLLGLGAPRPAGARSRASRPRATDLTELYRGAAVYVQANDEEGLGISVLEAMTGGLPAAATDTAGARECVADGRTGWLVRQDDTVNLAAAFAERLRQVLTVAGGAMESDGRRQCEAEFSSRQALERLMDSYDRSVPI